MKRWIIMIGISVSLALVFSLMVVAMGGPAPEKEKEVKSVEEVKKVEEKKVEVKKVEVETVKGGVFVIDDFESGSLKSPREWWTFDIDNAKTVSNKDYTGGEKTAAASVGKYSLLLKGAATNWYAGGCGTYLAKENQDLSKNDTFQLDIYGNGPGSGTIKIELLDDDNKNWQVEQDPAKSYAPIYDDKYVYDIIVDWKGWKRVSILLDDFVDDNPNIGDDVWNPEQAAGSGGLLQIQFVCLAGKAKGNVNFNIDNISLIVSE